MPSIQCPHCAAKFNVPETALGERGRCSKCQETFLVKLPQPADEYELAPLDIPAPLAPAPLSNVNPLGQPLPSTATPLGPKPPRSRSAGKKTTSRGNSRRRLRLERRSKRSVVPTGPAIVDDFVRFSLPE
jgi:predicted Zn finger-like uncharacterized protein